MLVTLFAQAAADGGPPPPFWTNPLFMFGIFGLFMVTMVWLPARRQKKEQEQMLAAMKPGTKVVTSAGIIGVVVRLKDGEDEVTLRSEDAKLKVLKSSVVRVLGTDDADTK